MRYVLSVHEDVAVAQAMGYARASGGIGVVNLHVAPGVAHGLGNLYNAFRARVPLLVTAGQHHAGLLLHVNIGAYVGSGSLVDTWATVSSGAQIGKRAHLAGGVGIGGVLEPAGSRLVIVEDDAFIGSRCSIVEGVIIEERAALGSQWR